MTRNAGNYERFCAEKIVALERFVAGEPQLKPERDDAVAGIYCWAAESIFEIEGQGPRFDSFVDRATALRPLEERVQRLRERASEDASGKPGERTTRSTP
jgi:hypothetical protein